MNIKGMTALEKSVKVAELHPDWRVRKEPGVVFGVKEPEASYGVYEYPGRRRLFVLTQSNNFYQTKAAESAGLHGWALPVIGWMNLNGIQTMASTPEKAGEIKTKGVVPEILDQILTAVEE